ncbi:MAG: HYR domain-containing protein [Phycisphaerales bacterium]|nr:HYR domain-containing protein [Phycisphaerales bacterium]
MKTCNGFSSGRLGRWLAAVLVWSAPQFASAQVSYERVARNGDPVPGRPAGVVFTGGAAEVFGVLSRPTINDTGYVAFRGVSGNQFNFTIDRAFGIYSSTLGSSPVRTVLVDTTSAFNVPGRAGTLFTNFDPPILTDGNVVIFRGEFGGGAGFYAVSALGGPITTIAESGTLGTPVPNTTGAATVATFNSGGFSDGATAPMFLAAVEDSAAPGNHYFTFIARFTEAGNQRVGVFAGTFTLGGAVFMRRVADDSATILTDEGYSIGGINTEYPPAINANGTLIFGCRVAGGLVRAVITDSAVAPAMVTRARENQASGTVFGNYGSTFSGYDINDAGRYLFHHRFNGGAEALFTNTLAGGSFRTVVATGGSFAVPGRPSAAFTSVAIAALNEGGLLGFQGTDNVVGVTDPQGLYRADAAACLTPDCVGLIANNSQVPPGQSPPSLFSRFESGGPGISAAINDNGNMAFAPIANLAPGDNLFGLYYYNTCTGAVERIVDKTVSSGVLPGGGSFGGSGTRGTRIYQGAEVRSGQYRALNNSDQVAFQVEFNPGDVGLYVATVPSGPLTITCPADVTIECGDDESPSENGFATATGCGTITISHSDAVSAPACVAHVVRTIQRTWTATNGTSSASCVQTITVVDTTAPAIFVPLPATVACTASTAPADLGFASGVDACDASVTIAYADTSAAGACPAERTITRTWTATDDCGNASSAVQVITVTSDAIPTLSVPANATVNCGGSTAPAATGTATGTAQCDSAPVIAYHDDTHTGVCAGSYSITRTWTITDSCGNTASLPQTITVIDNVPPVITLPANANVGCGGLTDPGSTGSATATDACSGVASITHADVVLGGACPASYTIQRTWTATDGCGNAASAVQLILVSDSSAPIVTVPADATVECRGSTLPAVTGIATAADGCSSVVDLSWSDEESSGACVNKRVRIISRTWTATDACGNTASQVQTITVEDNTPPTLVVPPAAAINCGDSTDTALTGMATASDNCDAQPSVTFVDHTAAGVCPTISVITRMWTATDACGNTTTGMQQISIVDNEPPLLECPPDVDVNLLHGQCEASNLNIGHATATDLCSEVAVTSNAPAEFPAGTTTVTWTATDACGNTTTCTQYVTVNDTRPPFVLSVVGTTMLWPPDYSMVPVGLFVCVSDRCESGIEPVITVYSNEDDDEPAPGGVRSPDARDIAPGTLRLRRERLGGCGGRVYLIVVRATDSSGNTATSCSTVVVPESRTLFSLIGVVLQAAQAQAYCIRNGSPPPGFVLVGDGPVIGIPQ